EDLAGGAKSRWTTYVVEANTELTGEDVFDANVAQGSGLETMPHVALQFTGPGGKRFADITGKNVQKRMAIILDGVVESAPNIQNKISGGNASITLGGNRPYNEVVQEAEDLVLILKSGSIPADIEVLEERQVGASLGPELANQGVKGVMVGLALVLVFMFVYYKRPGFVANVALVLNGLFLLALMGGFGFALTLPGIAGFILTLGMAVDANVLINERIRQELREGKSAKKALENGFDKVFWTIIDANVTTLIAAIVLMETNPSGPIRGFAVTLMIGLVVSVFTSLFCSRVFFEIVLSRKSSDKAVREFLGGAKIDASKPVFAFDFLKKGPFATGLAVALGVLVLITGAVKGVNWGVDFAGGTEVVVGFDKDVEVGQIRKVASEASVDSLTVQALGGGKKQYLMRFDAGKEVTENKDLSASAKSGKAVEMFAEFKDKIMSGLASFKPDIMQVDFVGPQIGHELRNQGIQSIFWAILGIFIYILMRFDLRFGPGAVVKMALDVLIMLGFFIFFQRTFDLTSVAAFLTVVGYSVNDTIVIYDRIRENISLHGRRTLGENINISINESLSRTINTSVTTVVALIGILIFGTGQIWNFAMAMTLGVIVATLSSTFVASSFVVWSEKWQKKRAKAKRSSASSSSQKPAHVR
ncbi:MAG: protein translocase subunit SecD, partial [Bdellovibrionota bacterium]